MLGIALAGPYNMAFVVAAIIVAALGWHQAKRRGWPLEARATLIATVLVAGIIGSRWLPIEGTLPTYGDKTVVGALVGATAALAAIGWRFRIGVAAFDIAVPAIPVGMALGRVGCFLAGCCVGTPTSAPWGVHYAATESVHPVQLYEAGADLVLALVITRVRHRLRSPGAAALAFISSYAVVRLFLEFVRLDGAVVGGLKPVQWALGAVAIMTAAVLLARERAARRALSAPPVAAMSLDGRARIARTREFAVCVFAAVAASLSWATPLERLTLLCGAAVMLLLLLLLVARRVVGTPTFGMPARASAMLILFQVGGAAPAVDSMYPRSYAVLGAGGSRTNYTSLEESCDGKTTFTRDHKASLATVSAGWQHQSTPTRGSGVTLGATFGAYEAAAGVSSLGQDLSRTYPAKSRSLTGGSIAINMDGKRAGLTIGASAGNFDLSSGSDARDAVWPIVGLRVGPLSSKFVELQGGVADVQWAPVGVLRAGVGFGMDSRGSVLRVGLTDVSRKYTGSALGVYLGYRAVTRSDWELEPWVAFGDNGSHARLAVRRRFTFGERPK